MARPPLWLSVQGAGATVTVSLATCRNCGKTKATSNPCSLDHLAAVMEFAAAHPDVRTPPATPLPEYDQHDHPQDCGGECG